MFIQLLPQGIPKNLGSLQAKVSIYRLKSMHFDCHDELKGGLWLGRRLVPTTLGASLITCGVIFFGGGAGVVHLAVSVAVCSPEHKATGQRQCLSTVPTIFTIYFYIYNLYLLLWCCGPEWLTVLCIFTAGSCTTARQIIKNLGSGLQQLSWSRDVNRNQALNQGVTFNLCWPGDDHYFGWGTGNPHTPHPSGHRLFFY